MNAKNCDLPMNKVVLYIFIGSPGAGKTTVAHAIERMTGAVHLWADHERQFMFEAVTHHKDESRELYDSLNTRTEQLLKNGKSVIFDTNFNYRSDRNRLRAIAEKCGAKTIVVWLQTPITVARDRALHPDHRDRNKYTSTMKAEQFDELTCHLQPPTKDELFITIDATDLDEADLKRQLKL